MNKKHLPFDLELGIEMQDYVGPLVLLHFSCRVARSWHPSLLSARMMGHGIDPCHSVKVSRQLELSSPEGQVEGSSTWTNLVLVLFAEFHRWKLIHISLTVP